MDVAGDLEKKFYRRGGNISLTEMDSRVSGWREYRVSE